MRSSESLYRRDTSTGIAAAYLHPSRTMHRLVQGIVAGRVCLCVWCLSSLKLAALATLPWHGHRGHGCMVSWAVAPRQAQPCVDEHHVLPAQCLVHCTVQVIPAHREGVNALSFSCSDLAYVTSSDDGTLKVSRCLFQEQPVRFRPLQALLGWPGVGRK